MSKINDKKIESTANMDIAFCSECQVLLSGKDLILDHANDNSQDNRLENLQILCKACNISKNPRRSLDLSV